MSNFLDILILVPLGLICGLLFLITLTIKNKLDELKENLVINRYKEYDQSEEINNLNKEIENFQNKQNRLISTLVDKDKTLESNEQQIHNLNEQYAKLKQTYDNEETQIHKFYAELMNEYNNLKNQFDILAESRKKLQNVYDTICGANQRLNDQYLVSCNKERINQQIIDKIHNLIKDSHEGVKYDI